MDLQSNINKNHIENEISLDLIMITISACFVDYVIEYIGGLPLVFVTIECGVACVMWRFSWVSLNACAFMVFGRWSSLILWHTIKENNWIACAYLSVVVGVVYTSLNVMWADW